LPHTGKKVTKTKQWPLRKPLIKPKLIFIYPKNISGRVFRGTYAAFSRWQEAIFPIVIAKTPVYHGAADERAKPGFVRSHIKMMWTTGPKGMRFKTIGVPGATKKGSAAYHALMAINSLHEGRAAFTIKGSPILTFPVKKGAIFSNQGTRGPGRTKGPTNWVITKKATQKAWPISKNPWLPQIWVSERGKLMKLLSFYYVMAGKESERKVRKKIEVS